MFDVCADTNVVVVAAVPPPCNLTPPDPTAVRSPLTVVFALTSRTPPVPLTSPVVIELIIKEAILSVLAVRLLTNAAAAFKFWTTRFVKLPVAVVSLVLGNRPLIVFMLL
jgi:hypothetical protein